MKKQELFERVVTWLNEVYETATKYGDPRDMEYYDGATAMAHRFISQFFTVNIDIERDDSGKHVIIDYNKP